MVDVVTDTGCVCDYDRLAERDGVEIAGLSR